MSLTMRRKRNQILGIKKDQFWILEKNEINEYFVDNLNELY